MLDQGYWPSTGITAPDDAALRRDVELAKSHGLQRRAQAPEDRRSALPVLGRSAGAARLGGDAERLSLHADVGRPASRASGPRRCCATSAIRASSPGCPSTNRGASPTCPTWPTERHFVRGLYHLTKTLDPTRPGHRQRRLGERRHRHHRHPRLRRLPRSHRAAVSRRRTSCRGCSGASGRAGACWCSRDRHQPISRSCSRSSAASATRQMPDGVWGYSRTTTARQFARQYAELLLAVAQHRRARRLLLHAVRRHLPGSQRPAVRGPHAEVPARRDRRGDERPRGAASPSSPSTRRRRAETVKKFGARNAMRNCWELGIPSSELMWTSLAIAPCRRHRGRYARIPDRARQSRSAGRSAARMASSRKAAMPFCV